GVPQDQWDCAGDQRQRAGHQRRDADPQKEEARRRDLHGKQCAAEDDPAPRPKFDDDASDHACCPSSDPAMPVAPRGSAGTLRARVPLWRGALEWGASEPNTSRAMAPMPPSDPTRADASNGIITILLLLEEPMRVRASVYFCATK